MYVNFNFEVSGYVSNSNMDFDESPGIETVLYDKLFQIWTDNNYVYCATENGFGIVPLY